MESGLYCLFRRKLEDTLGLCVLFYSLKVKLATYVCVSADRIYNILQAYSLNKRSMGSFIIFFPKNDDKQQKWQKTESLVYVW